MNTEDEELNEENEELDYEELFVPPASAPKEILDEWYAQAWSKEKAREEFLKNPNMSNKEFTKILSHLYQPDMLGNKAVMWKIGQEEITEDVRGFFENWLLAESNDPLVIMESFLDD